MPSHERYVVVGLARSGLAAAAAIARVWPGAAVTATLTDREPTGD